MRYSNFLIPAFFPALLLLFNACVTHPNKISRLKNELALGMQPNPDVLCKNISPDSKDGLLMMLERFRLQQLIGNISGSSASFIATHEFDRKLEEEKPTLAFSDLLHQTSAILINDNTLPYRLNDFERIMLYQLQIFNSMLEKPEDLSPLVNNLTAVQQRIREQKADVFRKAEETLRNSDNKDADAAWETISKNANFQKSTNENMEVAKTLSTLENAYAYYFCGVFFESQGKLGDAFLAYYAALRLQPNNRVLQRDVARTGGILGKASELRQFGLAPTSERLQEGHGEVVVFFEEEYIPAKQSCKLPPIPIPTGHGLLMINLALPLYLPAQERPTPALISFPGGNVTTELTTDLRNLAVKALADKMPEIVTRMAIRAIARAAANYALLKNAQSISDPRQRESAVLLLQTQQLLFHVVEEPDLRSWLMLPAFTQVARFSMPLGKQQITLQYKGIKQNFQVEVSKGRTTVAHCMTVPGRMTFSSAILPSPMWR